MHRVAHGIFGRVPYTLDTGGITLPDRLMPALAVFSLKIPTLLQFDRRVRHGEHPVLAHILCPWNRLKELDRIFAFPDRETFCRAIAGETGKEDYVGLNRCGPKPFRPRSNSPAATSHGNESAGPFVRPDRKSCQPRTNGLIRAPRAFV